MRSSLLVAMMLACIFNPADGAAQDAAVAPTETLTDSALGEHTLIESTQERVGNAIEFALSHIGVRYKFGGNTPESGFDCSGLVRWVFNRSWGVLLPRRSMDIATLGVPVEKGNLKPGDLVFFNTMRRAFSHVGIYLGDGKFLHAPARGSEVRVENIDQIYWNKRFSGARRIDPDAVPAALEEK
jgi:cell wall-associated NlpC family hydrolase